MAIVLGSVCAVLVVLHLVTSGWATAEIQQQDIRYDTLHRQRAAVAHCLGEKGREAYAACVGRQLGDKRAGNPDVTTVAMRDRSLIAGSADANVNGRTVYR